ncbi:DinI family protein [Salmonella enterica]|nr:DinI family protein [Salmonella enterica]
MRIELVISRTKQLPEGAVPALEKELITRLQNQYENCNLTIRRGSQDVLSIVGAADGDKKRIQSILQETWESADDWFYAY